MIVSKTLRIDESLNAALKLLGRNFGQPMNAIIVRALESWVRSELAKVDSDMTATLAKLRAYRARFGNFDTAIDDVASAEAALEYDPAEGSIVMSEFPVSRDLANLLDG